MNEHQSKNVAHKSFVLDATFCEKRNLFFSQFTTSDLMLLSVDIQVNQPVLHLTKERRNFTPFSRLASNLK